MTAGAFHEPRRGRVQWSFTDASPAEVRAALIPEEAAEFDQQWRETMAGPPKRWTCPRFWRRWTRGDGWRG